MPKYRYEGDGECRYGTMPVRKGDIIEASGPPGKRFVLVEEVPAAQEAPEEAPAKSRTRKSGGGE